MSSAILELGELTLTSCCSRCDVCCTVRLGVQFTGPHGYVTLCGICLVSIATRPDLELLGPLHNA